MIGHQDVRIIQLSGESLVVGCEVRGNVTLVKLHTLNGVDVDAEGLGLLNGNNAVLADNIHSVGNLAADDWITCGNGTDRSNLLLGRDVLCDALHLSDNSLNSLVDTATDCDWVCTSCNVTEALVNDDLCKQGCGGGTVADGVVSLGCYLFDQLSTHVLYWVLKLNLASNGDAIVSDGWCAVRTLQCDVATLRSKGGGYGICQGIYALSKLGTSVGAKIDIFSHGIPPK